MKLNDSLNIKLGLIAMMLDPQTIVLLGFDTFTIIIQLKFIALIFLDTINVQTTL